MQAAGSHRVLRYSQWDALLIGLSLAYAALLLAVPRIAAPRPSRGHRLPPVALAKGGDVAVETVLVLAVWAAIAAASPSFFLTVYAPGYLGGLGLCFLQGHFEHTRGTISHYGW